MPDLVVTTPGLPEHLRAATRTLHTHVERSPFMAALLRGQARRDTYCALLRSLHAIYAALEPALLRHAAHPVVAPVVMPALFRQSALERDLASVHGPAWREQLAVAPAAQRYAHHLAQLETDRPQRLVAHAYVRYLGDLSGGQLLARIVADSFKLADGVGTGFYDFGGAQQTRALTERFRHGLAAVPADAALQAELVAEAQHAFTMHGALFDELQAA